MFWLHLFESEKFELQLEPTTANYTKNQLQHKVVTYM